MDNITSVLNTTSSFSNGTTTHELTQNSATRPPKSYYVGTTAVVWKVIPPITIAWGTVGNILIFIVLLRQKKNISSTALYLMALAFSDTIVLYTGLLRQWIGHVWDYDIRHLSESVCRIHYYITYASLQCSSWLLVAVTLERAFSVVFPHMVKIVSTKTTAVAVISTLFTLTYGFNILFLAIMQLKGNSQEPIACRPSDETYLSFLVDIYSWIHFCVVFAAPFTLMLVGNVSIIVCLQKSRANLTLMNAVQGQSGTSFAHDSRSVSLLMVALSVIFLLAMGPTSIFYPIMHYKVKQISQLSSTDLYKAWHEYEFLMFQKEIVDLVSYINASFNFILYVFSGSKFRKELKAAFNCTATGKPEIFGPKSQSSGCFQEATTSCSVTTGQDPIY